MYAENKSGLERRYVVQAVVAPLVLVVLLAFLGPASSALAAVLIFPALIAFFWAVVSVLGVIAIWPVGIRVDSAGIRIGGVQAWERRQLSGRWPPRKPFHVGSQGRAVFTCPWPGVRELYLVGSRAEIMPLVRRKRAFRRGTQQLGAPLGWLGFARAGLVIVNDPALAGSDPAAFRPNRRWPGHVRGVASPTWVVPTRHPEALRAALARAAGAPAVHDQLPPADRFSFSP